MNALFVAWRANDLQHVIRNREAPSLRASHGPRHRHPWKPPNDEKEQPMRKSEHNKPASQAGKGPIGVGLAWFRRDEWPQLLASAADRREAGRHLRRMAARSAKTPARYGDPRHCDREGRRRYRRTIGLVPARESPAGRRCASEFCFVQIAKEQARQVMRIMAVSVSAFQVAQLSIDGDAAARMPF